MQQYYNGFRMITQWIRVSSDCASVCVYQGHSSKDITGDWSLEELCNSL